MKYKFFNISVFGAEEESMLNRFLSSHKVLEIDKHFYQNGNSPYWAFCVKYYGESGATNFIATKPKIDYKEKLSAEHFQIFTKLREIRKQMAQSEAIPAYAIFTDEELANIAVLPEISYGQLLQVNGIGDKKREKYGAAIIDALNFEKKG